MSDGSDAPNDLTLAELLNSSRSDNWADRARAAGLMSQYFDRPLVRARLEAMFVDDNLAVTEAVVRAMVGGGGVGGLRLVFALKVKNRSNEQLSWTVREELMDDNNRGRLPIWQYCAEIESEDVSGDIRQEVAHLRPRLEPWTGTWTADADRPGFDQE